MDFHGIAWHSIVLHGKYGIALFCVLLNSNQYDLMVLHHIILFCMVFYGISNYCVLSNGIVGY